METGACKFIRNFSAGLDADVIAANNSILGCHADGEGTGCGKVVCCLVVAHADGDLIEICDYTPCSIHGIRVAIFVVCCNNQNRKWIHVWFCSKIYSAHWLFLLFCLIFFIITLTANFNTRDFLCKFS